MFPEQAGPGRPRHPASPGSGAPGAQVALQRGACQGLRSRPSPAPSLRSPSHLGPGHTTWVPHTCVSHTWGPLRWSLPAAGPSASVWAPSGSWRCGRWKSGWSRPRGTRVSAPPPSAQTPGLSIPDCAWRPPFLAGNSRGGLEVSAGRARAPDPLFLRPGKQGPFSENIPPAPDWPLCDSGAGSVPAPRPWRPLRASRRRP